MVSFIRSLHFDEAQLIRSQNNKNARDHALTDLLKENHFSLKDTDNNGSYDIHLQIIDNKIIFNIVTSDHQHKVFNISLAALRQIFKDYGIICESYSDAVKAYDPRKIEAIDMGRRGLHNEGAEILQVLLSDYVVTDFETARNLFSLIYWLQVK